ncbi:MAG: hypothetical protein ACPGU7_05820 [Gammaproteobacteria bacterium]
MQWLAKNFLNVYLAALVVIGFLIRDDLFGGDEEHMPVAAAETEVAVISGTAQAAEAAPSVAGTPGAVPVSEFGTSDGAVAGGAKEATAGALEPGGGVADVVAATDSTPPGSEPARAATAGGGDAASDSGTAVSDAADATPVSARPVPPPADDPRLSDEDYARAVEADRQGRPLEEVLGALFASQAPVSAIPPMPDQGLTTPAQVEDAINAARRAFWSNNLTEAVHTYARILDAQPDNWAILGELGNVLMTAGHVRDALRVYEESAHLMWDAGQYMRAWHMTRVIARYAPERAMDLAQGFSGGTPRPGTEPQGQGATEPNAKQ